MSPVMLAAYLLKFYLPGLFSVLFRGFGLGYRSRRRFLTGVIVYTVFTLGLSALLILGLGYGAYTHLAALVMLSGGLAVLIYSTDPPAKTIFLQLTQSCLTTAVSVPLNLARTVFGWSYPALALVMAAVCPLVYWLALRCWAKPLRFMADNLRAEPAALIALPLLVTAAVYVVPVYPAMNFANHPLYCTALMLGLELIYFLFMYVLYRNLHTISRLLLEQANAKLLEAELGSYQASLDTAKQARHDLRHHNAVVLDFLQSGDTAGAMDYLRANDQALAAAKPARYSANPAANAVLRVYARRAQEREIAFAVNAEFPENLPLSAPELGALLSNLLENAVEACGRVESAGRRICLTAETGETGLQLEIRNSASGRAAFENGLPVSTKPGGGTGTRSIARIVRGCGGMLRFRQENGEFIVQIVLPLR